MAVGLTPSGSAAILPDIAAAQLSPPYSAAVLTAALDVAAVGGGAEVAMAVDGHRAMASLGPAGLRWSYDISRCCVPGVRSESGERQLASSVVCRPSEVADIQGGVRGCGWVVGGTVMEVGCCVCAVCRVRL